MYGNVSTQTANQCHLFHPNGDIVVMNFLYCALVNEQMMETCSDSAPASNIHYAVSFFIIGFVTSLIPNLFGTLFGVFWKSKVPDLSALSSRQRSMSNALMAHRSLKNVIVRKLVAWTLIVLILIGCLIGEYFIELTHFCQHVKGGRYTYCVVVIFTGLFIFKCIQLITSYQNT